MANIPTENKELSSVSLGEKLKELRQNEGLSQEQLAERLNLSRSTIAKWESDAGIPEVENLILIAREFDISMDWLLSVNDYTCRISPTKPQIVINVICE